MTAVKLDPITNDLIDGETNEYVTGTELVSQNVRAALSLITGESIVYPDAGVNWLDRLFRKRTNIDAIEATLRAKIIEVEGISQIISFSTVFNPDRSVTYSVAARLSDGVVLTSSGVLNAG